MRVHIERGGGFAAPAMRRSRTVETDTLSEEEAGTLRQLVEAAGLPGVAARAATPGAQPRPDEFCYRLVVEDGGTRYTAEVRDSDMPDSVRPLIAWLMKQ